MIKYKKLILFLNLIMLSITLLSCGKTDKDNNTYDHIYFGYYPQEIVEDKNIIDELGKIIDTEDDGYLYYDNQKYLKVKAIPYRDETLETTSSTVKSVSGNVTIERNMTIYCKVSPIKWRIIKETDMTYELISEYILDKSLYYEDLLDRNEDGNLIYPNNYEYSTIRTYLNNDFYNKAFLDLDKEKIVLTNNDYVYLLDDKKAISSEYKFTTNGSRQSIVTDYARATGTYTSQYSGYYGYGDYWISSSTPLPSSKRVVARNISYVGNIGEKDVNIDSKGVRPCITILK